MKIILLSDVENLGESGDVIAVKPGYARNKLIPQGLALRASNRNIAVANENKRVATAKLERENQALNVLAKKLSKVEITIEVKVGDEEKMFGSITNKDIHKELIDKGFEIEKNQISIEEPIKALGIYHINIKISKDITSDVKLYVIKG
ncbi:MAG: 50S ribosomal protein L9 [Candidatus Marinimicrobia bacterium]|jgi:large subunit ribosomal protein L9|nr:50S ribosomal protein L9 [Candidatus Neomarinimicrobiota bacterium]|tara:strand:- start:57 stop:500 length:444 start_codon:yes stop_codon:yes gene_type:complete